MQPPPSRWAPPPPLPPHRQRRPTAVLPPAARPVSTSACSSVPDLTCHPKQARFGRLFQDRLQSTHSTICSSSSRRALCSKAFSDSPTLNHPPPRPISNHAGHPLPLPGCRQALGPGELCARRLPPLREAFITHPVLLCLPVPAHTRPQPRRAPVLFCARMMAGHYPNPTLSCTPPIARKGPALSIGAARTPPVRPSMLLPALPAPPHLRRPPAR